jgi:hypothetical protein
MRNPASSNGHLGPEVGLALLNGVTPDGPGKWKALCPAHEKDGKHTPSLGVVQRELEKHKGWSGLFLKCFSKGCSSENILAALKLKNWDVFHFPTVSAHPVPGNGATVTPINASELREKAESYHAAFLKSENAFDKRSSAFTYATKTRCIPREVCIAVEMGVDGSVNKETGKDWTNIVTPYLLHGEVIALKRRSLAEKGYWWTPKGLKAQVLYGVDELRADGTAIGCEGEFDALTLIAAGQTAVSLPSGVGTATAEVLEPLQTQSSSTSPSMRMLRAKPRR